MIAISRTGRLLRRLVRLSCRRPAITVGVSLLLAAAAVAYTAHALTFKTSGRDAAAPERGLRDPLHRVRAGVRRARGHRGGGRGAHLRGRQGLRGPPRPGAPGSAGQVPARRLPHRPQALRGPPAPLPLDPRAAGDPRQDLRPPGVHGELRGRPEPGPPARGREHPVGGRLRHQPLRPRPPGQGPAGGHALPARAPRPDGEPPRAPRALPLALGHPLLVRRGPARRRGLLPLRRQEPALHPGGDAAQREGQLHGRPGRHRDDPRGGRQAAARLPERAGGRHRGARRSPTTR